MEENEFDEKLENGEIKEVKREEPEFKETQEVIPPKTIKDYESFLEMLRRIKMHSDSVPTYTPKSFLEQFYLYLSGSTYRFYIYIKDAWKKIYDSSGLAPTAHKASHQDTGTDEINVGGLSGELADNQPPKSHALDSHSVPAGNIAMNSKKFTGLVDPNANQDSATKKYHDDNLITASAVYGDGSDGDVDITSGSFSSGPITNNALTRHAYFDNLTLSGGNLNCAGYRLCVGTLTINSSYKVHRDGNAAAGDNGGAALSATDLGGSAAGGNGQTGSGSTVGGSTTESLGGNGGAGGDTPSGGAGSAGGTATITTSKLFRMTPFAIMLTNFVGTTKFTGGAGGGGGNAYRIGNDRGGGGGGGGGVVLICAKTIVNNGAISANGGDGADGVCDGGEAAGGGAGGGGLLVIIYGSKSGSGTYTSTKGGVGTGCNTGDNGDIGVDGTVIQIPN